MPLVRFELTFSAGYRTQIYALDGAATGIGFEGLKKNIYIYILVLLN